MSEPRRVFTAVFAVALSVAALLVGGCAGDPSLDGLGVPEFLSVSAQPNKNSIVLTCTFKGRAGMCGFVVADSQGTKKLEASSRTDGSFSLTVSNLEYDTEYTYYAWISNGSAEIHSNTGTVHTELLPVIDPEIINVSAVVVKNSISLTCTFKGDGVGKCGFVLSKTQGGEVVKRQEASKIGDGFFTLTIDELEYDTKYTYYAWITHGTAEIRSKTGTACTEKKPVVPPEIVSVSFEADENVLTLNGTYKGDDVDGWGFYFNGTKYGSDSHEDGKFSLTVSDLEYDTDYDYQAYITSGQVEVTSDVKTARTGKLSSVPIPDAVFKAYILNLYDLDRNGKLSMEEAEKITRLDIGTYDLQIKSLEGIEYFKNLEYLKAAGNGEAQRGDVSRLDLSKNLKLETLICSFNKLYELLLGNNTTLKYIDCHSNTELFVKIGENPSLRYLDCNYTEELDGNLGGCTSLEYIDCSYLVRLSNLNVAGLKKLATLNCEGNNWVEKFDASSCESLVFDNHIFKGNCFTSFKAAGCSKLTSMDVTTMGGFMTCIDVSDCKNLKSLKLSGVALEQLDVRGCTALSELECWDNYIAELDVSSQKKLKLGAWPQLDSFYKIWVGSGEYHYFNSSGEAVNPADYGTEVIVKQ